jgi:PAS domain S-box-containing protein
VPDAPRARNLVLILAKDLTSRLATPAFVVDREGTLLYFNEAAEPVLGLSYAEAGEMRGEQWAKLFEPRDDEGNQIPFEELPIGIAITHHKPAHQALTIQAADGVRRPLAVTALPLFAHADEFVGAVAVFWERED